MNNSLLQLKVKERLNKLDSNDYDNITPWRIIEAFNKAQLMWCRFILSPTNKAGDEQTKNRISDLQVLLTDLPLVLVDKITYYESTNWPPDFLGFKLVKATATKDCCSDRDMRVYLTEEANSSILLSDENSKPSFEWGETFNTLFNNTVRIYTNDEFDIKKAILVYYREPRPIQILGQVNPATGLVSTQEVESEFKNDIIEVLIDITVNILSGDIESITQYQISQQNILKNE